MIIGAVVLSVLFKVGGFIGRIWLSLPGWMFIVLFGALLYLVSQHYLNLVFVLAYSFLAFVIYATPRPLTRIMVAVMWIILLTAYWQALPLNIEAHYVVLR